MATNPCKGIEAMVRMIVGRLHVSTDDDEAADYVASRLNPDVDARTVARVRRCAIKIHKQNRDLYRRVMWGM